MTYKGIGECRAITLTNSIDQLNGTSGNDTFIGDNSGAVATVTAGDAITGGAGTDTLKLYSTAAVLPQVTGVENLVLNNPGVATINVASLTDVTSVTLENVEVTAATGAGGENLTLAQGQALTLKSVVDVTGGGHALDIDGAATLVSLNLTLDGAGTATTAGNDLEVNFDGADMLATLNITTANNASKVTFTDADNKIATITVAGDKAVDLGTLTTNVTSFNASAMTAGGVTVNMGASAKDTTITGSAAADSVTATAAVNYTIDLGAGNDTLITADAAGELTSTDSLAGGDGTDTLGIASAVAAELDDGTAADNAVLAKVTGFEQLRITDNLAADFNISKWGMNYLQLADDVSDGGVGTSIAVSGFTSGATIELRDAANHTDTLDVEMTGATGAGTDSDTLNLFLNANIANNDTFTYKFDVEGINIVNINAVDRDNSDNATDKDDGYVVQLDGNANNHSANVKTVNITGSSEVSYTVDAGETALSLVDGSASTGNLIISAAAFVGTQGVSIKTGAGNDSVKGAAGLADLFATGAGRDIIQISNDGTTGTVVLDSTTTKYDAISDFALTTETIGAGAIANVAAFAAATAGGANVDILDLTLEEAGGTQDLTANVEADEVDTNVAAAITGATNLKASITKGIVTLSGTDASMVDTLAEWVLIAQAVTEDDSDTVAFQFNGNTYVFATPDASVPATDMLIELTGVTGVTGIADVASASSAGYILLG